MRLAAFAVSLALAGAPSMAAEPDGLAEAHAGARAALGAWKASRAQAARRAPKPAPAPKRRAVARYEASCILQGVLAIMARPFDPGKPLPAVSYESLTPLQRFQDAVEAQWGMRPPMFANVYVAARNEIFIMDDAEYYERTRRFVDDSLAHELAHYVQVRYKGIRIEDFDDSLESEAVSVQTEFRERFMKAGASPCPAR